MDTQTFSRAIRSCERLPEKVRSRALAIGEKLEADADRAELARRLTQADEQVLAAEAKAEQSLTVLESDLGGAERAFARVSLSEREAPDRRSEEEGPETVNGNQNSSFSAA